MLKRRTVLSSAALGRERFAHDALHGLARIERAVRVLEHHLEIAPRAR